MPFLGGGPDMSLRSSAVAGYHLLVSHAITLALLPAAAVGIVSPPPTHPFPDPPVGGMVVGGIHCCLVSVVLFA
jgi:hypothetical protein